MEQATATWVGKPVWVDLSSGQPEGSREFYSRLLGWQIDVSPDPQYGGYATAKVADKDAAGIGPKMMPEAPTAWAVYIGTNDLEETTRKVQAAGGKVIAPPMQVGDQGRMAVYRDPIGAFIAAWQPVAMSGFGGGGDGTFGWAELNAHGRDRALPFYQAVFGWTTRSTDMGPDQPPYVEFLLDGESVAGANELPRNVDANVPPHWLVYFNVADVDAAQRKALDLGASEVVPPMDFPGGRFSEVMDPQGAVVALVKFDPRQG